VPSIGGCTVQGPRNSALERTARKLQGESCISLEEAPSAKQQIACTRSFGHPISGLPDLIEAISEFASRAVEKLRRQSSLAGAIHVFAHTSPFRAGPRFSGSTVVPLIRPTADSRLLVQAAVRGATQIRKPGFALTKAGVMLLDLVPETYAQGELGFDEPAQKDRGNLMAAVDVLNNRFGRGAVHLASALGVGARPDWAMRQERLTPQYTTKWSDLPVARA